jgi:hypothetical protein
MFSPTSNVVEEQGYGEITVVQIVIDPVRHYGMRIPVRYDERSNPTV